MTEKMTFIVRELDKEVKKGIKLIAVEKDITMAEAIKLIYEFYKEKSKE